MGSIPGLENLKETYSDCTQTKARLDVIIDKIKKIKENSSLKEINLKDFSDNTSEVNSDFGNSDHL